MPAKGKRLIDRSMDAFPSGQKIGLLSLQVVLASPDLQHGLL